MERSEIQALLDKREIERDPNLDKRIKQAKVDKLVNRARACRTFDGLEVVADDARSMGLWHAGDGAIIEAVSKCNARLRGRHVPAQYRKGSKTIVVSDDKVVKLPWIRSRQVCADGWLYAGPAND